MGRRIIAIFAAAVIALVGVTSVLLYARGADARAVEAQQPVDVYVAKEKVAAGTVLKDAVRKDLVVKTKVASIGRPAGALTTVDDSNSSLLALTDIQPGEYLLSARFGTTPAGVKAIEVPAGMVAVSVQLSDPARVGTFVTPGSHLALYESFKIKSLGTDEKAKALNNADIHGTSLLLGDVLVIGMGQTALTPGDGAPTTDDSKSSKSTTTSGGTNGSPQFLVTVAVLPADAVRLVHGIQNGDVYAGLMGSDLSRKTLESQTLITDLNAVDLAGAVK
jgi:pilus assembly protein CpaB